MGWFLFFVILMIIFSDDNSNTGVISRPDPTTNPPTSRNFIDKEN